MSRNDNGAAVLDSQTGEKIIHGNCNQSKEERTAHYQR